MLALTGQAWHWEPKRLRLRLFSAAAQLVTTDRRRTLRLARHWPWTDMITSAFERHSPCAWEGVRSSPGSLGAAETLTPTWPSAPSATTDRRIVTSF